MNTIRESPIIYTIGHSTHSLTYFLELLNAHSIECVADVRSVPASRHTPQFNQTPLSAFLRKQGKIYMPFCAEFGARNDDAVVLDECGVVDFQKVVKTASFLRGVERLQHGIAQGYRIALMCSEAEPFDCHRFVMIADALQCTGFKVMHIMKDNSLQTNESLELQLLRKYRKKLPQPSFFEPDVSPEMQLREAYRLRNRDIGYDTSEA
jgi:uncharacterized protein (DUF488 family)